MKILLAPTEEFIKEAKTEITSDVAAGSAVVIPVINSTGIVALDYICLGEFGSPKAEVCVVSSVTTTSITLATVKLAHSQDEPLTKIRYNTRKFYGAVVAGGSYTELTSYGSPVALGVNDPAGTYLEYTGNEGYIYFKSTYYNSHDGVETQQSDSTETLGDESARYCSLYAIRRQAGLLDNPYITDSVIETYRLRAENEINSYLYQRYVLPLLNQTTNLPEVPFVVENCCTLLAAGYMDYREYGKDGEGVKWLGEARSLLKAMQSGTQRLIGSDMIEFQQKELTQGIQAFPSSNDPCDPSAPKFGMNKQF